MTLDKLEQKKNAIITKVGGEGPLRLRLLDMGIIPKTKVQVIKRAPLGDPIEIRVRGYEVTLRLEDARLIEIEIEK
ncbi:MAG: ferrous iron transport protein A [Ruminococcaceae bacterium]|nr:ferrous iron transport protein A [Oscillospiraceae bacterium]